MGRVAHASRVLAIASRNRELSLIITSRFIWPFVESSVRRDAPTVRAGPALRVLPRNKGENHSLGVLLVDEATPGYRRCVDLRQLQPGADTGC